MLAVLAASASDLLWGTDVSGYVVKAGAGTVFMTAILTLIYDSYRAPGRRGRFARAHPGLFMTGAALVVIAVFAIVVFAERKPGPIEPPTVTGPNAHYWARP